MFDTSMFIYVQTDTNIKYNYKKIKAEIDCRKPTKVTRNTKIIFYNKRIQTAVYLYTYLWYKN